MPLSPGFKPEPKVLRVCSILPVLPERKVNLFDGKNLTLRGVNVTQLQAGEGRWLTDNANEPSGGKNVILLYRLSMKKLFT